MELTSASFPPERALQIAREKDLDVFVVQPDANPPVGRLMDYGKYKFEQERRAQKVRQKFGLPGVKQLRMRYEIGDRDYQTKLLSARAFLKDGDTVKLCVTLRGREIEHADLALALLSRFANDLTDVATSRAAPALEGKTAVLVLAPM